MRIRLGSFLALLLLGAAAVRPAESLPLAERAAAAFQGQDWQRAERLYGELLADPGQRGMAAFRRAVAQLHLGRIAEARAGLDRAEREGWIPAAVAFRRACADALEGRRESAFAQLNRAVAAGFSQLALLDTEPLLASLRGEPAFAEVKESLQRQATPCRFDERYRAFDFWLGEWDVRPAGAPESAPPSQNILTLEYDGCVVMEHWQSAGGGTGSSFNVFDASRNTWFQTWVDSSGGLHEYRGGPDAEGNMLFVGEIPGAPGQPARVPTKLSFFRLGPDKVRQWSQTSIDGGKTWATAYDLIYTRRRPAETRAAGLEDDDRRAIALQLEAYRTAWLAGDAARVQSLFLDDAAFLPHHGLEPVEGLDALKGFWWPAGGPETHIVRFDLETRRVEGTGELAYAWGRQRLEWTQADGKKVKRFRTQGNHLTVLRKTAAGWRIALQMGDDEPNERF